MQWHTRTPAAPRATAGKSRSNDASLGMPPFSAGNDPSKQQAGHQEKAPGDSFILPARGSLFPIPIFNSIQNHSLIVVNFNAQSATLGQVCGYSQDPWQV